MIQQTPLESHPSWEQPIGSLMDKADAGELSHEEALSEMVALCVELVEESALTQLGAVQAYLRKRNAVTRIVALQFNQEAQSKYTCIDYETNEARQYYFMVFPTDIAKMSLAARQMSDDIHEMILRHDTGVLAPVELLQDKNPA